MSLSMWILYFDLVGELGTKKIKIKGKTKGKENTDRESVTFLCLSSQMHDRMDSYCTSNVFCNFSSIWDFQNLVFAQYDQENSLQYNNN